MFTQKIMTLSLVSTMVIWFILLLIVSIKVNDSAYIFNNPMRFAFETIMIMVFSLLTFVVVYKSRSIPLNKNMIIVMLIQVIIFNILFQLSGMYSYTAKFISN